MSRIPFFCAQPLAGGRVVYHWKPSPRLRRLGWANVRLGSDYEVAAKQARALNDEIASGTLPARRSDRSTAPSGQKRTVLTPTERRIRALERRKRWCEREIHLLRSGEMKAPLGTRYVYFIAAIGGPIKIGLAKVPQERLKDLQTSHPKELRLLAWVIADEGKEKEYHLRFADHRLSGEWFARHPDILEEIRRIKISQRSAPLPLPRATRRPNSPKPIG